MFDVDATCGLHTTYPNSGEPVKRVHMGLGNSSMLMGCFHFLKLDVDDYDLILTLIICTEDRTFVGN
jgi:hypothetical protein